MQEHTPSYTLIEQCTQVVAEFNSIRHSRDTVSLLPMRHVVETLPLTYRFCHVHHLLGMSSPAASAASRMYW